MWADLGAGIDVVLVDGTPESMPGPIVAFFGLSDRRGSRLRDFLAEGAARAATAASGAGDD